MSQYSQCEGHGTLPFFHWYIIISTISSRNGAMAAITAMACTGVSSRREPNFKAPIHLGLVLALGAPLSLLSLLNPFEPFELWHPSETRQPGS